MSEQFLEAILQAAKNTERNCFMEEGCTCGALAFASFVIELERIVLGKGKAE